MLETKHRRFHEGQVCVHSNNYANIMEAIDANALYSTGSSMERNYTVLADIRESMDAMAECLGYKNEFTAYFFTGLGFIKLDYYLEQLGKAL